MSSLRPCSLPEEPVYIMADGALCELRVWSDAEWIGMPADRPRPVRVEHVAGLGWVGAVPIPRTFYRSLAVVKQ